MEYAQEIRALELRIQHLERKQAQFSEEIADLRDALDRLKMAREQATALVADEAAIERPAQEEAARRVQLPPLPKERPVRPKRPAPNPIDWEKFIGENLINKIGIAITVLGVAVGAKYSIDHDLISPATRIVLGYLMGIALLVFGIRLKERYAQYSAALVSGALAIMYIVTYMGYTMFALMPQMVAFALMVLLTVGAVFAAIQYAREVIALFGMVGAYAVPFLLSDGSGKVAVLFTYMAIINLGILFISFWKDWKRLYYAAFAFTWLIFLGWYANRYQTEEHFFMALGFLLCFFCIFYIAFMAYKLRKAEPFQVTTTVMLLLNNFIFYGVGYSMLEMHEAGSQFLGLFTVANALLHLMVGAFIYNRTLADPKLLYLVIGQALVFITLAIPVQLNGHWVTLLWGLEAFAIFFIARTRQLSVYEKLSYLMMALALVSLMQDWETGYHSYDIGRPETRVFPIFNQHFLTSALLIICYGAINFVHGKYKETDLNVSWRMLGNAMLPALLIITLYCSPFVEIAAYWDQQYADSQIEITSADGGYPYFEYNYALQQFKTAWLIIYTLLFLSATSVVNMRWIQSEAGAKVNVFANASAIVLTLMSGLLVVSELREYYMASPSVPYYSRTGIYMGIRYIMLASLALLMGVSYLYQQRLLPVLEKQGSLFLHLAILWVASSELIHWMELAQSTQSYKLGISILWGSYALLLIALGIWKKHKYLRVAAIALFAITLAKLFFYDIAHLDTLAKTVVFVSLGVLLLIISFLYNKYKHLITDDEGAV